MDLKEAARVQKGEAYRHPWELSRADSIISLLNNVPRGIRYADIGAGDRYFARAVSHFTRSPVYAVDVGYTGVEQDEATICLSSVDIIPDGEIDCVVLLDVLEHVEDERTFLEDMLGKLRGSGRLVITVPAFQFLFSSHDRFLEHKRRYNRKQLIDVLSKADITVERSFYFYFSLIFIRLIQTLLEMVRSRGKGNEGAGSWRFAERHPFTCLFRAALNTDFAICNFMSRLGIYLPGLSLCCLCKKKSA